jgi:hypothetical protein
LSIIEANENFCTFFNVPTVRVTRAPDAGTYASPWVSRLVELVAAHRDALTRDEVATHAGLCLRSLIALAVGELRTEDEIRELLDEVDAVLSVSVVTFTQDLCATYRERRKVRHRPPHP